MTSPWEIPKQSPFTSTKEDKRNFGRNNGARGGSLPEFIKPKNTTIHLAKKKDTNERSPGV